MGAQPRDRNDVFGREGVHFRPAHLDFRYFAQTLGGGVATPSWRRCRLTRRACAQHFGHHAVAERCPHFARRNTQGERVGPQYVPESNPLLSPSTLSAQLASTARSAHRGCAPLLRRRGSSLPSRRCSRAARWAGRVTPRSVRRYPARRRGEARFLHARSGRTAAASGYRVVGDRNPSVPQRHQPTGSASATLSVSPPLHILRRPHSQYAIPDNVCPGFVRSSARVRAGLARPALNGGLIS